MAKRNGLGRIGAALLIAFWLLGGLSTACTTAVISGRVTKDGRPILWKNRDYASAPHNEVAILTDGHYRVIAVVNAGSRSSIWMGANEVGFCIENSLSTDLRTEEESTGPGNGSFMKLALGSCANVSEFQQLLEKTNASGRRTTGNFGVIDAQGGAAIFEVGPHSYTMFDANDPQVAPHGYVVRSNFATTAQGFGPNPTPEQLSQVSSGARYRRACDLLDLRFEQGIDIEYILRNLARDLADAEGRSIPGTVNAPSGDLPAAIITSHTLSRSTTVSAAVFHGVLPGEDPRLTTMWTVLGDPKFSIAVPCWATVEAVADPLEDKRGGEIGEIARLLRDWCLTVDATGVQTAGLPGIWEDLWDLECRLIRQALDARTSGDTATVSDQRLTALHAAQAEQAMVAMRQELLQAKESALYGATDSNSPAAKLIRVAIYDHSDGSAKGPKNLMRFLTQDAGFEAHRVSPAEIQSGALAEVDVLIVPGGSGSAQSQRLETVGREAVKKFVDEGGGYVGICAGSYLASSHYAWSLGIINARVWDRAHWARGTGTVALKLSPSGQYNLMHPEDSLEVFYGQGPLLVPGNHPDLQAYEVLATYQSEIAEKGAPEEAMVGTHAIVRAPFGRGRVICFSPHPETSSGPNHLIIAGTRWAAGKP